MGHSVINRKTHGISYGSDLKLFTRCGPVWPSVAQCEKMSAVSYGPEDVALAHAAEVFTLLIATKLDA